MKFNNGWDEFFLQEDIQEKIKLIDSKLKKIKTKKKVYPKQKDLFLAFELTCPKKIKVVILGQDPYHRENQAMGLSFSVLNNQKSPPSLTNIKKEIHNNFKNIKREIPNDLTYLAKQNVFLLNSILSVEKAKPLSHKNLNWQEVTDAALVYLSKKRENLVFLLWGNYAKEKEDLLNTKKHLILKATHPSPFSAYRGFFFKNHFIQANNYLKKTNQKIINWL